MASLSLGLIIELLVASLLLVTIGYCIVLNRRLVRLRADEEMMRKTVVDLVNATDLAEKSIQSLHKTVGECEHSLSMRIDEAENYSHEITHLIQNGESVLRRLTMVAEQNETHRLLAQSALKKTLPQRVISEPAAAISRKGHRQDPQSLNNTKYAAQKAKIEVTSSASKANAYSSPSSQSFKDRMIDIDRMAKEMMQRTQQRVS